MLLLLCLMQQFVLEGFRGVLEFVLVWACSCVARDMCINVITNVTCDLDNTKQVYVFD